MTDREYSKLCEFMVVHNAMIPTNDNAREIVEQKIGSSVSFKEWTKRDLRYHRQYFLLLNYIYSWLPESFRESVSQDHFYVWLKHLKGNYKILFQFKDGTKLVEYDSISFGKMSQVSFSKYVKEQLPWIYEEVIWKLLPDTAQMVIDNIEYEHERFLGNL